MSSKKPAWAANLQPGSIDFMNEIIGQIPETMGVRAAFIAILENIAKPTREVEQRLAKLQCLENGGVDNWDGYDFAMEQFNELFGDEEEEDEDDN
jgi:hypothetical protein